MFKTGKSIYSKSFIGRNSWKLLFLIVLSCSVIVFNVLEAVKSYRCDEFSITKKKKKVTEELGLASTVSVAFAQFCSSKNSRGFMVYVIDCNIVVSEFEL